MGCKYKKIIFNYIKYMSAIIKKIVISCIIVIYAFWASTFSHMISMNHLNSRQDAMHHEVSQEKRADSNDCKEICRYIEQNKTLSTLVLPPIKTVHYSHFLFPVAIFTHDILLLIPNDNPHIPPWIPIISNPIVHHIKSTVLLI